MSSSDVETESGASDTEPSDFENFDREDINGGDDGMDPWDVDWEADWYSDVNDHVLTPDTAAASMGDHAGKACQGDSDTDEMPHLTDESDSEVERKPPSMPCRKTKKRYAKHRAKLAAQVPFNACVARPVGKKEVSQVKEACDSAQAEWHRLKAKKVWDETVIREWDDVAAEARRKNKKIHVWHVFCICVETNSELPKGHTSMK